MVWGRNDSVSGCEVSQNNYDNHKAFARTSAFSNMADSESGAEFEVKLTVQTKINRICPTFDPVYKTFDPPTFCTWRLTILTC